MKRINIYLTKEQEDFLNDIKKDTGASLAWIIRSLIDNEQKTRGWTWDQRNDREIKKD